MSESARRAGGWVPHLDPQGKVCDVQGVTIYRRKLRRIEEATHARYLTFSCEKRLPLFSNDRIKDAFVEQLTLTRSRLQFQLFAWVIMPEHVHLLMQTGDAGCSVTQVLQSLKRPFATKVLARFRELEAPILNRLTDAQGMHHFWLRGGGYDRNIVSTQELMEKVGYIHANPCRRDFVARPTDWAWSSARWYAGDGNALIEMDGLPT